MLYYSFEKLKNQTKFLIKKISVFWVANHSFLTAEAEIISDDEENEDEGRQNNANAKYDDDSDVYLDADEDVFEEDERRPTKIQFCVCENKSDSANSELCDRCSNRYHVECAADDEAKRAFKERRNPRDHVDFLCFKCRRVTTLIKKYEHEIRASGRWDSDCEDALTLNDESSSSNDTQVSSTSKSESPPPSASKKTPIRSDDSVIEIERPEKSNPKQLSHSKSTDSALSSTHRQVSSQSSHDTESTSSTSSASGSVCGAGGIPISRRISYQEKIGAVNFFFPHSFFLILLRFFSIFKF